MDPYNPHVAALMAHIRTLSPGHLLCLLGAAHPSHAAGCCAIVNRRLDTYWYPVVAQADSWEALRVLVGA